MGVVERGRLPPSFARALGWARASALRVHVVGDADAAAPVEALLRGDDAPRARRAGIRPAAEVAAANVLVVAGPGEPGDADPLATYHAMPHPKYVVAVGDGVGVAPDLLPEVPVDVALAGGRPSTGEVFEALLDLQDLILAEDPAERWQAGPVRRLSSERSS
jgi:NADH:ubiquinone oxidoreductase subunit B-like Fe-S oxidoreductase